MIIVAYTVFLVAVATVNASPSTNLQSSIASPGAQFTSQETPAATHNEPGENSKLRPHSAETVTVSLKGDSAGSEQRNVSIEMSTSDEWERTEDDAEQASNSRCPAKCECAELSDRTIYNCSLPSGVLKFEEFGDGIIFTCYSGILKCSELPLPGLNAGTLSPNGTVRSVSVRGCALADEPLLCSLRRRGASAVERITLSGPLTPFSADQARGLDTLTVLRITDLDGKETELPQAAIALLPSLKLLALDNAHLKLSEQLPPLQLRALELADDQLHTLPNAPFRRLTQLRRLGLWRNHFQQIAEDTLEGLESLQELSLSSNRLVGLPEGLLAPTRLLRNIDLYDNELTSLPRALFAGLTQLEEVRLQDNRGNLSLEEGVFSNLSALKDLDLSRSGVGSLPEDAFRGCGALKRLRLGGNSLTSLPAHLLRNLTTLESLDLSRNSLKAIPKDFFVDQENLFELMLDHNQLETLPSFVFRGLGKVETLTLGHNRLRTIDSGAFGTMRSLLQLSLEHNELFGERSWGLEGQYLSLGGPPSPFNGLSLLTHLNLSHNRVRQLLDDWRIVLVGLRKLDLSWNQISDFDYVSMNFVSSNVVVDLRHNNITTVNLRDDIEGSAVFLLDENPFECDCHAAALQVALRKGEAPPAPAQPPRPRLVAPSARCAAPSALQGLPVLQAPRSLLRCDLPAPHCPPPCRCLLLPDHLDLTCATLPPRLPSPADHGLTFSHLRLRHVNGSLRSLPAHVRRLDLSEANLTEVPELPPAVEVDLVGNEVTSVPIEALANSSITLRLARNPLACDCGHKWEIAALLSAGPQTVLDYRNLTCSDLTPVRSVRPEDLCLFRDNVTYASIAFAILFFVTIATALGIRYRVKILIIADKLGCCPPEEDGEKEKDFFISFAHPDSELAEKIVARLEAAPHSLRACFHLRDWVAGEWIPAQIARSVDGARWTLILLSRHFLVSVWGLLEFREAYLRVLKNGKARILIVLIDDVTSDPLMTDELRSYLAVNTYLHLNDSQFWDKLAYALRRRRRFLRRHPSPSPAPAPPADKLLGSALEAKLALGGALAGPFTSPSVVDIFTNTHPHKQHHIDAHVA